VKKLLTEEEKKERKKARDAKYRIANKEKIAMYRSKNKDKIAIKTAEYRAKHPDKASAWRKKYRDENIDKIKIKQKQYREQNKEKLKISYDKWLTDNKEYRKQYLAEYNKSVNGKMSRKRRYKKQCLKQPELIKAKRVVNNALRDGKIIKQPCRVCGTTENIEAHHVNYKPTHHLIVIWLCRTHHRELHKSNRIMKREIA
jgi:hypothetical protein